MRRRVFISSTRGTSIDPYRDAVRDAVYRLGFEPVFMENMVPTRAASAEHCKNEVRSCDALVLLLGHKYGSIVPGTGISYTELEYRTALADPDMEILVWMVDPNQPWHPQEIATGDEAAALETFRTELGSGKHLIGTFGDIASFRLDTAIALAGVASRMAAAKPKPSPGFTLVRPQPVRPEPVTIPRYVGDTVFTGRAEQIHWLNSWGASSNGVAVVEAIGGTGKSALTWQWFQAEAPQSIPNLAGRFWWSFYDSSNSLTRFQQRLLQYATGCSAEEAEQLPPLDLSQAVVAALSQKPILVVMDGFERLLNAYHHFNAETLSDMDVERQPHRNARAMTDPLAYQFVRSLASVQPGKILISTRLMPDALIGHTQKPLPHVDHMILPGLTTPEVSTLLRDLGIEATEKAVETFFVPLDNHPLLIGVVAGLVANYRAAPNNFDKWLADPLHGQAFSISGATAADLSHRILSQALDGLDENQIALLQGIAITPGTSSWEMVNVISPYRPDSPLLEATEIPKYLLEFLRRRQDLKGGSLPSGNLAVALSDLEERGLVWWDRVSNRYDMHPVIRSYVAETTDDNLRLATSRKLVRDHFGRQQARNVTTVSSVDDLLPEITEFQTLVGARYFDMANRFWTDRLQDPLLAKLGAYPAVSQLLGFVDGIDVEGHLKFTAQWDLATAESSTGKVRSALNRRVWILGAIINGSSRPDSILPALNNMANESFATRNSAHAHAYLGLLQEFASILGDSDSNRLRSDSWAETISRRAGNYEDALEIVKNLQAGPVHTPNPLWTSELLQEEYELLWLIGKLSDDEDFSVGEYRFGTHPYSRVAWAELVFELAQRAGNHERSLEAARAADYWIGRQGCEMLPAKAAIALARQGFADEAHRTLDDALNRLDNLDPEARPYFDIARAFDALGANDRAAHYALQAFEQAWEDGPGYHSVEDVRKATSLLTTLGVEVPTLPARTVHDSDVPVLPELREFLRKIEEQARKAEE